MKVTADRTFGQWWEHDEETVAVDIHKLRAFGVASLVAAGASEKAARFLFEIFLEKSLQGDHARGVDKFTPMVRGAAAGKVDLAPDIRVVAERPATAFLDGGQRAAKGLVCRAGMELAIEKARSAGIACVAVRNTSHSLAPMMRMATDAGMIGIATIASPPLVAPLGGKEALLGNAPLAIGIPAGRHAPVLLDLSLTNSSGAGVLLAAQQGALVPEGAYLDPDGNPERDVAGHMGTVDRASGRGLTGSLAVLGSGHKGYGLLLAIDLLTRILARADQPWDMVDTLDSRYGATMIAIDVAAFTDPHAALAQIDGYLDAVVAAPRRDGVAEILYPGLKSQQLRAAAIERGVVDLPISQLETLASIAEELGLELDVRA